MIGLAFLFAAFAVVAAYSHALDVRDERRRQQRLDAWYHENGGGE